MQLSCSVGVADVEELIFLGNLKHLFAYLKATVLTV